MTICADSLPTRHSLLSRMRDLGDSESWRVFFDAYWRLIYNVARKSGLSDDQAQDVVQETVISVARAMPEFRYDATKGSFKQWLLLICRRRIQDQLRRLYSTRELLQRESVEIGKFADTLPAPETPDGEIQSTWEREWRENVYRLALERVREHGNPKHFQIFDLCVLRGMSAPQVASMLRVSAARVYLAKHRVAAAVKRAARAVELELMRERAVSMPPEFEVPRQAA